MDRVCFRSRQVQVQRRTRGDHVPVAIFENRVTNGFEFVDGPVYVFELQDIIGFLGFFLVVLISLELMRSVWMYVNDHTVHIKVMFEIAIIAVTRKIILLEPGSEPLYLLGVAALVISLAGGYYLAVKKIPG